MIGHYVRRFFTSLSRRPPTDADERWVESIVSSEELLLFRRLSNTDRRHLVHSARMVERLDPSIDPIWVRAAVLHDVGKYSAHLGVFGRVVATVLATVLGASRMDAWATRSGWRGRIGRYQRHGEIGAAEIRASHGPEEAAVWSELHHHRDQFATSALPAAALGILDAADH
ncbi:MAG: hypothetical protein JJE46_05765 [Acidimicrobiia bacterium]|nr:hypothetical protein [Acidimicrobiia bacterium]